MEALLLQKADGPPSHAAYAGMRYGLLERLRRALWPASQLNGCCAAPVAALGMCYVMPDATDLGYPSDRFAQAFA